MITFFRIAFILFWTALMITSALVVMLFTFNRKIALVMARTMHGPGIVWASGIRLKIEGAENFDHNEPHIFVANHQSYLDIPCLFNAIPVNLHFVAKKELKWVPFIGWFLAATGMIFIDRSNRKKAIISLDKAGKIIKNGKNVIMFPEGTRKGAEGISTFKKGPFMLAANAKVSVVPVTISGTEKVLPANNFRINPGTVVVRIGKPIVPSESKADLPVFIDQVRNEVIAMQEV